MANVKSRKREAASASPLDRWNSWIENHRRAVLFVVAGLTLLFSLLLFNARISEGGDDSLYIEAGYRYAQDFTGYWYSANAPGYPLFLALPIKLFGVNVVLLKAISVIFYLLGAILVWKALVDRVKGVVLVPVMVIMAVNAYGQYFASETYTEAFFFFVQGFFLWCFFRLLDQGEDLTDLRRSWKWWLLMGVALVVCSVVKNIAIMAAPAVIVFFLLSRHWKAAGFTVVAFAVGRGAWELLKRTVWGSIDQYGAQGGMLRQKDPYDASKGLEDNAGLVTRFLDNVSIYMGKRFWEIIGVLQRDPVTNAETKNNFTFLALVLLALLVWAFVRVLRSRDRALLFLFCYSAAVLAASFLVLQVRWDQPRIILVVVPFLLMLVLGTLADMLWKGSMGSRIYSVLVGVLILLSLWRSTTQAYDNLPILQENLKGDAYAGYTPDWVNFLRMSRWCADNLPPDAYVMSRKAPMSFIYGKGKKFYPVYKVIAMDAKTKQSDPDSVLAILKREHVTHILLASIRLQPKVNNGQVINTIHNVLQPLAKKYPGKLHLVHQEGKSEPSYLYAVTP